MNINTNNKIFSIARISVVHLGLSAFICVNLCLSVFKNINILFNIYIFSIIALLKPENFHLHFSQIDMKLWCPR